jgi:hypothetical protein
MAWHRQHAPLPAVVLTGLAGLLAGASQSFAGDASYCVTCTGPDQIYLCRVDAGGAKPSDALKLYCVVRTAKEGHHGSCSAERATAVCNGVLKVYSYDGPMPEDIATGVKHFTDKIKQDQKAFEKPKGDQPKSLVELTGRAVSASRQGWRNARNRFGGASQEADPVPPDESVTVNQSPAPLAAESAPALSSDTAQSSRVQRASSAVGGFARKSARCVFSFFRKCSDEAAQGETLR